MGKEYITAEIGLSICRYSTVKEKKKRHYTGTSLINHFYILDQSKEIVSVHPATQWYSLTPLAIEDARSSS